MGYALAEPDPHDRAAVLAATGHSYLPSLSWFALVMGVAALVAGISLGYLHRPGGAGIGFAKAAGRLVLLQAAGFVLLEVVERFLAEAPADSLSPLLLTVGLLSQIVCASLAAGLVVGSRRVGEYPLRDGRLAYPAGRPSTLVVLHRPFPRSCFSWRERVRGPPRGPRRLADDKEGASFEAFAAGVIRYRLCWGLRLARPGARRSGRRGEPVHRGLGERARLLGEPNAMQVFVEMRDPARGPRTRSTWKSASEAGSRMR